MMRHFGARQSTAVWVCVAALWVAGAARSADKALEFEVTIASNVSSAPVSGRLFVMLAKPGSGEPRNGPNWFNPQPFFAKDVHELPAESPANLGNDCLA